MTLPDLIEQAWGIIANAGDGDWDRESPEWQEAAARWRDEYHLWLAHTNRVVSEGALPPRYEYVGAAERIQALLNRATPEMIADAAGEPVPFVNQPPTFAVRDDATVDVVPILAGLIESNYAEFHAAGERMAAQRESIGADVTTYADFARANGLLTPEEMMAGLVRDSSSPDAPHVVGGGT